MNQPRLLKIEGVDIAVRTAGDPTRPALLLVHGFPSSSESFRDVIGPLAKTCYVIAPDLPGFGRSDPIERPTFSRYADVLGGVLEALRVESFHLYLHDYGAAAALHLAMRAPQRIRGLIVQNANAHPSGIGPQWAATQAYWADPTPEREVAATAHLTYEGMREQYVGGLPPDLAQRIDPQRWQEDWRVLSLPGRLELQRALVHDYGRHVARFDDIARYLAQWQPPALMLWGRHDIFFELDETLSWMRSLPRMQAHVLDGPHFLLETHAAECAALIGAFIDSAEDRRR